MEPRDRTSRGSRRGALSLALLAVQLLVFTLGATLAGQSHARTGPSRAHVVATTCARVDGAARIAAAPNPRVDQAARARGDRDGRSGAAPPPLDLALPPAVHVVAPASLSGSLDWRSAAREHRSSRAVINGARGPPSA